VFAGFGYLRCTLSGKDMDTQGRVFESGVAVWSLLLLLEDPLHGHLDTPPTAGCIDDHARPVGPEPVIYQALSFPFNLACGFVTRYGE
jgi:hypothetical protein